MVGLERDVLTIVIRDRQQRNNVHAANICPYMQDEVGDRGEYLSCCAGYGNIACDRLCYIVHGNSRVCTVKLQYGLNIVHFGSHLHKK